MSQVEIVFLAIIITKKRFWIFLTSYKLDRILQFFSASRFKEGGLSWVTYLNKVYDWFEERRKIQAIVDDITSEYVPPHVNIFYCLRGITLTCFLVQVATILL